MRYLSLGEVVRLHEWLIESSGGASGIRDLGLLDSALAQPRATFDGEDLHWTVLDKAAALCASLVQNHRTRLWAQPSGRRRGLASGARHTVRF
jgi:death-on-curing protein